MQWAPDSPDLWAPDSGRPNQWAPDTFEHLTLRRGVDLFLGAKSAEGASPKTITWYRMILDRAVRALGADLPVDRLTGPDLRAWLVEVRTTLAPVSVAGYVRTLKVFGNWLQASSVGDPLSPPTQSWRPTGSNGLQGDRSLRDGDLPMLRARLIRPRSTQVCELASMQACALLEAADRREVAAILHVTC